MTTLKKGTVVLLVAGGIILGSIGVVAAQQGAVGTWQHHMGNRMAGWYDSYADSGDGAWGCDRQRQGRRHHRHGRHMQNGRDGDRMCRYDGRMMGGDLDGSLPQVDGDPQLEETVPAPTSYGNSDPRVRGRSLVAEIGCQSCHRIGASGGQVGPSLNGVISRQGEPFVNSKLANPRFDNPSSRMPDLNLSNEEIDAIVAYLETLDRS